MNAEAFIILEGLGLTTPQTFSLRAAIAAEPKTSFYLRYSTAAEKRSHVESGQQIRDKPEELAHEFEMGALIAIERTYTALLGGATLCKPGFMYTEIVKDHPISLLRRGLCGARIISRKGLSPKVLHTFQGWSAIQGNSYKWSPLQGPTEDEVQEITCQIRDAIPIPKRSMLLEWLFTTSGLVFCDAKQEHFETFGNSIHQIAESSEILVQDGPLRTSTCPCVVDGFDIDLRPRVPDGGAIVACNGAILSHFVTRCRNRPITIKLWNKDHGRN